MRKFIFTFVLAMTSMFAFGQAKFSGNLGTTLAVEPHNSNLIAFPMTVNGGLGARFATGFYVGGGLGLGADVEYGHIKEFNWSKTETTFIMPVYLQLSYIRPHGGYFADLKFGEELAIADGNSASFLFVNVTPIGYTFDNHNSIGLGWRYHHKNDFNGHGIALTYQYTF